jgi:hypothetical protein
MVLEGVLSLAFCGFSEMLLQSPAPSIDLWVFLWVPGLPPCLVIHSAGPVPSFWEEKKRGLRKIKGIRGLCRAAVKLRDQGGN